MTAVDHTRLTDAHRLRVQRRRAALLVCAVALLNVASAVTPPLASRLRWLLDLAPVEIPQAAGSALVFASIALLVIARGLRRGMVTVEMGKEDLVELTRMHAGGGQAHRHSAAAVEEQVQSTGLHEVCGSGTVRRRQRRARAEQCERG